MVESDVYGTDGYAYLNLDNPICAWATYRSFLVEPPAEPGFVSVWMASLLHEPTTSVAQREFALERVRAKQFPSRLSRLRGMFCFFDAESASAAAEWGAPFTKANLAEVSLAHAAGPRDRLDANWITYRGGDPNPEWMHRYWRGDSYPGRKPIWEALVGGRIVVLGTDVQQRAYERLRVAFPDSLALLEIARQAAWVGHDLGNISAFVSITDRYRLQYTFDMREADDPVLLAKLAELQRQPGMVNHRDLAPHISKGSFGRIPDLHQYGFDRPALPVD